MALAAKTAGTQKDWAKYDFIHSRNLEVNEMGAFMWMDSPSTENQWCNLLNERQGLKTDELIFTVIRLAQPT